MAQKITVSVRELVEAAEREVETVPASEVKFPPDSAMTEVRLGVTVTSLYTLVSLGLILAFT